MRRGVLAVLAIAALSGCSLLSSGLQDQHGATVQVKPDSVMVSAGDWDVLGGVVTIYGADLRVNEPSCKAVEMHLECTLPAFPAGRNYVLPLSGSHVVADAVVLRPDGLAYTARRIQ